jgi:hypothetical protein
VTVNGVNTIDGSAGLRGGGGGLTKGFKAGE